MSVLRGICLALSLYLQKPRPARQEFFLQGGLSSRSHSPRVTWDLLPLGGWTTVSHFPWISPGPPPEVRSPRVAQLKLVSKN